MGALNIGAKTRHLDVSRVLAADLTTLEIGPVLDVHFLTSLKTAAALLFCPRALHNAPENIIFGGWSMGCLFAMVASGFFQLCLVPPRAIFMIENRNTPPYARSLVYRQSEGSPDQNSRDLKAGGSLKVYRAVNFMDKMSRIQNDVHCIDFFCETGHLTGLVQDMDAVQARHQLHVRGSDLYYFPDTVHNLVGVDHYWDIARRLRVALSAPGHEFLGRAGQPAG
jgi:hypothetical protein